MNKEELIKKIKIISIIAIVLLGVWFLIVNPFIKFKNNENKMLEASKRYFETNSNELPTGERIRTIYLKDLFKQGLLKEDIYVPLTKKACSITESWVKVKHENGEYKYYPYLKCGVLSSIVDHKGPEITLNGKDVITINKGDKYVELGIKSINDNKDGKIDVTKAMINSKKVNTKKTGTYEVVYTAFDSLNNKTEKKRVVKVVSKLKNVVKKSTNGLGYYKGREVNNYIKFSGMLFRIVGIDNNNVKIISDRNISDVNYDGISEWLDYYYEHLNKNSKKYIVENKYCNMKLDNNNINSTECSSYTNNKKVYIISATEVNRSLIDGDSFLKPSVISWVSNEKDQNEAYATRDVFYEEELGKTFLGFNRKYNYGVRPVITIKGSSLIKGGNGTINNPYSLKEVKKAKSNDNLNTRYTGEYISYANRTWRIIETEEDGTTKVICNDTLNTSQDDFLISYDTKSKAKIYNPTEKGNIGYYIQNKSSKFIDTKYFVKKEISVPIYKKNINYKKEVETKKYSVKLSAPNTYEMFSSFDSGITLGSYWYLNSTKTENKKLAVIDMGYIVNEDISDSLEYGVRPVGYLDRNIKVISGNGTVNNPYKISK